MEKENKKVYLSGGEEVELLATYQCGNKTEYVVSVVVGENCYEGDCRPVHESRIVSNVYENYNDIPLYSRKTELEKEAEKLRNEIRDLKEQKSKLTKEMRSVYNPKYPIGTPVFFALWGNEIEELKITRIDFTEQEDRGFYHYYCDKGYRGFEEIGNDYYLTREEAEKARQEYIQEEEGKKRKQIIENYKKAKREYEKITN